MQITKFNNILSTASKNLMKSSFFRAQRTPVYSLVHLNDSQIYNFIMCTADNWLLTMTTQTMTRDHHDHSARTVTIHVQLVTIKHKLHHNSSCMAN